MKRKEVVENTKIWVQAHTRQLAIGAGVAALIVICVQLIYPSGTLLPFASVDSVDVGGMEKTDATKQLDTAINAKKIPIFISKDSEPYVTVAPAKIGLQISNKQRIDDAGYPLWARIIPGSLLWYQVTYGDGMPEYTRNDETMAKFLDTSLGGCDVAPMNATLTYKDKALQVVEAKDGGSCDAAQVRKTIGSVSPTITEPAKITLSVDVTKPEVKNEEAKKLKEELEAATKDGVSIAVGETKQVIEQDDVLLWLDFSTKKDAITYLFDEKKSNDYFAKNVAQKVTKPAGVTKVKTQDFTELSRKNGASGIALNADGTRKSILAVLQGASDSAKVVTAAINPKVDYDRSYTKTSTGISALVSQYGVDNAGTFGVSFQEIGGAGRSASYNGSQSFITASTYKLFVAYGTLKKIEAEDWKWSDDVVGGRDLSTCFDDMIVKSDNACAEALYKKIGYQKVIDDVRKLGLSNTTLASDAQRTSADDLRTFLTKLQTGSIGLKESSRSRLIEAMKRNQYRQGIPSGATGQVADKVGFLNGLLHDAAIVYSPKGPYVLVIMTDGSSWANIADLTKKIESLR